MCGLLDYCAIHECYPLFHHNLKGVNRPLQWLVFEEHCDSLIDLQQIVFNLCCFLNNCSQQRCDAHECEYSIHDRNNGNWLLTQVNWTKFND